MVPERELLVMTLASILITSVAAFWLNLSLTPLLLMGVGYCAVAVSVAQGIGGQADLGCANRVTFYRALAVVFLAAALAEPRWVAGLPWLWTGLALTVLALDGLDGYLARRLGESSEFGARFDMEVDAALILTLCVAVWLLGVTGPWILLLGLMRYAFVVAGWIQPWIKRPLPPSFRRKTICVWQIASLLIALLPITPSPLAVPILALALILLAYSFTLDLAWLYRAGEQHENHLPE